MAHHLQEVNVAEPGSEPSILEPVAEDMRLQGPDLCDKKGMRLMPGWSMASSSWLLQAPGASPTLGWNAPKS